MTQRATSVWTYQVEREIEAEVADVQTAISAVVARHWGDGAHAVTAYATLGRIDAVHDVWLTWSVEAIGTATHVRLVLEELEPGPDPTEALEQVLADVADEATVGGRDSRRHRASSADPGEVV